jgi:hypothetical protein
MELVHKALRAEARGTRIPARVAADALAEFLVPEGGALGFAHGVQLGEIGVRVGLVARRHGIADQLIADRRRARAAVGAVHHGDFITSPDTSGAENTQIVVSIEEWVLIVPLDLDRNATGIYGIDFNRAYHPFCYYNPLYDCPYPPAENRLNVPIRAGERVKTANH